MQRIWSEGAGFLDNWSGGIYRVTANGSTKMYVEFAGISDTFSGSGTTWATDKADGSTLTVNGSNQWVYTDRDGVVILFDPIPTQKYGTTNSCPGADVSSCSVPLAITRPDGLTFTLNWTKGSCQDSCGSKQGVLFERLGSVVFVGRL